MDDTNGLPCPVPCRRFQPMQNSCRRCEVRMLPPSPSLRGPSPCQSALSTSHSLSAASSKQPRAFRPSGGHGSNLQSHIGVQGNRRTGCPCIPVFILFLLATFSRTLAEKNIEKLRSGYIKKTHIILNLNILFILQLKVL